MMVTLASLGLRPALLVGFTVPTSFLLCFALLAAMGVAISNIVMFGLILAVGMLVDGAIVVVEYADKRIREGQGPMRAYGEAAKRMFWPIVSSTATTLCAFLPMLFWPGVAGEFMKMLPITLIYVLSASLLSALIFLPVIGGEAGRLSRFLHRIAHRLHALPLWARLVLFLASLALTFAGAMLALGPERIGLRMSVLGVLPGAVLFALGAAAVSVTVDGVLPERGGPRRIETRRREGLFGGLIRLIVTNPIMPLVTIAAVFGAVVAIFMLYQQKSLGVEFFVETEPERAIAYVEARGNLSLDEKDALLRQAEKVVMATPGVRSVFSFAGNGGLRQFSGGAQPPKDTIGQIQIELIPWEERGGVPKGKEILERINRDLNALPGLRAQVLPQEMGPASAKPVHLRLTGEDLGELAAAVAKVRARMEATPGLAKVEDTTPLPGIDWQIDVDTEKAGRFGADVATVGAMVQLVTQGLLLDTMRVPSSDDEIDIRVRLPREQRLLSTLRTLRVRTKTGLVPLANFISIRPVRSLAEINRVDGKRYYDVKAALDPLATKPDGKPYTATDRIEELTRWLRTEADLGEGIGWEWVGDQQDQEESAQFLSKAFLAALGLMAVILLAQFNSFYNSVLVLLAVVLSTAGVLVGMMVMQQPFSVIMTGTGVVALAGIVVNNNIVLIDTYQEYAAYMPRLEAIVRTARDRLRPVLLTTVTTVAGLMPMMFGVSIDFANGGYTIDAPTALWWKPLATAVVFGLSIATVLTLVLTPSLLALRVWLASGVYGSLRLLAAVLGGPDSRAARDRALARAARRLGDRVLVFDEAEGAEAGRPAGEPAPAPGEPAPQPPLKAAE
ncbi:MAG: efflux RND transporter permease subunit, partial [Alphaproteobacteria bacterium]